ncbi:hypothetical protein [Acinetobacter venetianus]|uniref:hypothetical protein n=1 Tax=Acinetobacter venetianus TaxID=52133 RepID=UPI003850737D
MSDNILKFTVAFPFKYGKAKFSIKKLSNWGVVDYVFLKAISMKEYSLQELSKYSNLDKQIVIQILLPMMKNGWIKLVSYNSDFYFNITDSGLKACKGSKLPDKEESYERYRDFLVDIDNNYYGVKKLKLIPESEARVNELRNNQDNFIKISLPKCEVYPNEKLMFKAVGFQNEKILDILGDFHYGIVDTKYILFDLHFDKNKKEIIFHDDDLVRLFSKPVIDVFYHYPYYESNNKNIIKKDYKSKKHKFFTKSSFVLDKSSLNTILGGPKNKEEFIRLIRESDEYLIIHSTFIGKWCIKSKDNDYTDIFLEIKNALKRNVKVFILWGKDEPDEEDEDFDKSDYEIKVIEDLLTNFNNDCFKEKIFNTVEFNSFSKTGSHTKFVISKTKLGIELLFGSCNFLYTEFLRFEASFLIADINFIKNFLSIAADISSGKDLHSNSVRKILKRFSNEIPESNFTPSEAIKVNLVLKYQHYDYIDLAKKICERELYIISDKLNDVAARPIADALKSSSFRKFAYFSERSEKFTPAMEKKFTKYLATNPININLRLHDPKVRIDVNKNPKKNHAKVLLWDSNHLLITSLNWLSANASYSPSSTDIYHEIGIYVEAENVAESFLDVFRKL